MKVLRLIFLVLGLLFAVIFAPQLEISSVGVVVMLVGVAMFFSGKARGAWGWTGWLVTVAVGYGLWRAWASPAVDGGRADGYLLLIGWMVFCWAKVFSSEGERGALRVVLGVVVVVSVLIGLYQVVFDPLFTPVFAKRLTASFASGFSGHYNHFANFMLGAGFLLSGGLLRVMSRGKKIGLGILLGVCVVGILLSQSRGAYLALGVGVAVWLVWWLVQLRKQKVKSFGLMVLVVAVGLPVLGGLGYAGANVFLASREQAGMSENVLVSDRGRSDYFGFALDQALDHALVGAGSRSFAYESYRYWRPGSLNANELEFVHNEFLQVAADYGFVGLGLVVLVLGGCVLRGKWDLLVEKDADFCAEKLGALAALVAMLVQSMFSFVFHMAPDVILLGICLGLLARRSGKIASAEGGESKLVWGASVLSVGAAVGAVVMSFPDVRAWWYVGRPGALGKSGDRSEQYQGVRDALKIREDSTWQMIAAKLCNLFAAESKGVVEAGEWTGRASEYVSAAIVRNPYDPSTRLLYARFLDAQGRLDEADGYYQFLLPRMDAREHVFHARFLYARHCYLKSYVLWKSGDGDAGLGWAQEAVEQMKLSHDLCWYGSDSLFGRELERAEKFVLYLRSKNFQLREDQLPPKVARWD